MIELVKLEEEFEANLYNNLSDFVKHRNVTLVHLIRIPHDFVFSVKTGAEYLRLETKWYLLEDSYARRDSLLHVIPK